MHSENMYINEGKGSKNIPHFLDCPPALLNSKHGLAEAVVDTLKTQWGELKIHGGGDMESP